MAEVLGGRSVEEWRNVLLAEELITWAAYFEWKAEAERKAMDDAKRKAEVSAAEPKRRRTMGRR